MRCCGEGTDKRLLDHGTGESVVMDLSYVSFLLFAAFSSLRMVSYLPQIYSVATDKNGASAISYSTWVLWVAANSTTALYAFNNLNDRYLAFVSVVYAGCCVSVILLTAVKRRSHRLSTSPPQTMMPAMARWVGPRLVVALGAMVAIAVGFSARWALPDGLQHMARAAINLRSVPPSESAVGDTPFEEGILQTLTTSVDNPPIPVAQATEAPPTPARRIRVDAKPHPKGKGLARSQIASRSSAPSRKPASLSDDDADE
jgi:hypothetical protein